MTPELKRIPLTLIRENPVALRSVNQQDEGFLKMVDSVKKDGVLNPISVRRKLEGQGGKPDGREYELIDGLHRYTSSLVAGLPDIPVQVLEKSDAEALTAQIIGNVHKVDTKPIEYTRGLLRVLANNPLMTEAELAAMLSVSPGFINQRLSLTRLDPKVQEAVNSGQINLANAYPLTKLPPEEQLQFVERAMTMGTAEFGPLVQARAKQIRDARRVGEGAAPEAFQPMPRLLKLSELKAELESPTVGPQLVQINKIKNPAEAFALGVAWALQMDPQSQENQKARDAERRKKADDEKAKREAERAQKRAAEAQTKQQQLIADAETKRKEAEARGMTVDTATATAGV